MVSRPLLERQEKDNYTDFGDVRQENYSIYVDADGLVLVIVGLILAGLPTGEGVANHKGSYGQGLFKTLKVLVRDACISREDVKGGLLQEKGRGHFRLPYVLIRTITKDGTLGLMLIKSGLGVIENISGLHRWYIVSIF